MASMTSCIVTMTLLARSIYWPRGECLSEGESSTCTMPMK